MYDLEDPFSIKPVTLMSVSDSSSVTQKHDNPSPSNPQISTRAQNLVMQYHDFTQHNQSRNSGNPQNGGTPAGAGADEGHHFFDCPKVWERIVMHPRFDEVDVEALCAELSAKVRIVPPTEPLSPFTLFVSFSPLFSFLSFVWS